MINPPESASTDTSLDDDNILVFQAISQVDNLIEGSKRNRQRRDTVNGKRFARLLKDPQAVSVTMSLTDEVMRITSTTRAAKTLRRIAKISPVQGLGLIDFCGIKIAGFVSLIFPKLIMTVVHYRVRNGAAGIILPSEQAPLARHIAKRKKDRANLNINLLGEAVLGENEANDRLASLIKIIERKEVNYASVKISSIVSQLITIDFEGSHERVLQQLNKLFTVAKREGVFINLDMEEFRDLAITIRVFKSLLSQDEFCELNAGIVLQAYLPEAHAAFAELANWAVDRRRKGGGQIKIRLVKGANLAMEKAEAELHGWVAAPYPSKADVDASYARLIDVALRPDYADAVRIGIASHNLFHLAWAIAVATKRGVLHQIDIEMLEGMANAQALTIIEKMGSVLLYTPVTSRSDFPSAVAYLVRRLDENTAVENYLRASFEMEVKNPEYEVQKIRFIQSVKDRHNISTVSRRHRMVRHDAKAQAAAGEFLNARDSDFTEATLHHSMVNAIASEIANEKESAPRKKPEPPTIAVIDQAIARALSAAPAWEGRGAKVRAEILNNVANVMEEERCKSIAVMALEAGKTVAEADPEVSEAIDFARYYGLSAGVIDNLSQFSSAAGVVLVVPPWNFPYAIPAGGVFAGLAAGNCVILKPAPETVATAYLLAEQLWRGGVPRDVLQFLATPDDESGKYLVTHPDIARVILTGAFDTAVMFTSWRADLNLLAETSGKNAIFITASADIDSAVKDLVQSAFGHAGQKCSAASLAIVEDSIYRNPAFLRQLRDAVMSLRVGNGWEFSTSMGPVIKKPAGALLRALTTLDEGESWLVKPEQIAGSEILWSPGVKLGVRPGSWSHQNEWFGPVLGVISAPNFATGLLWQNSVAYGLTAGIHSLDQEECEEWIEKIEAGNLYINRTITGAIVNRQPFGGWKASSVGPTAKAGGSHYVGVLREWHELSDAVKFKAEALSWWNLFGSRSLDYSGLSVERNYQRYRPLKNSVLLRIDQETSDAVIAAITSISKITGTEISWSAAKTDNRIPHLTLESIADLCQRIANQKVVPDKIRWLSAEQAPSLTLLKKGISVDKRVITGVVSVEMQRWLHEQSIAITNHRYGNVGAGPHPTL